MSELRTIDKRGTLVLPPAMRQGINLVEIEQRPDGVIELRPKAVIDQSQTWFWSARWQAMEREVDAAIVAGHVQRFDDDEALIAALDDAARANP